VLTFEGRRCVGELSHRRGELVPRPVHLFDHGECPGRRPHQTAPIPQIEEVGGERRRVRDRVGAVAQGPAGALLGEGATVGIGARSLTWGVHVVSATSGGSREALIAERKGTGGETDGTLPLLRRRGRGRKPTALADRVGNPRRRYAERRACRMDGAVAGGSARRAEGRATRSYGRVTPSIRGPRRWREASRRCGSRRGRPLRSAHPPSRPSRGTARTLGSC